MSATYETWRASVPAVTEQGPLTLLTGVIMEHSAHCYRQCRKAIYLYSEGGTVRVGIEQGRAGARWVQEYHPGPVTVPDVCPECGEGRPRLYSPTDAPGGSVFGSVYRIVSATYDRVRQTPGYAELVAEADVAAGIRPVTPPPPKVAARAVSPAKLRAFVAELAGADAGQLDPAELVRRARALVGLS